MVLWNTPWNYEYDSDYNFVCLRRQYLRKTLPVSREDLDVTGHPFLKHGSLETLFVERSFDRKIHAATLWISSLCEFYY